MAELKDQRVVTMMSAEELKAIDDWRFAERIGSRGEAIRKLCQIGMGSGDAVEMLKIAFRQFHQVLSALRDAKDGGPGGPALIKSSADAIVLVLAQALKVAVPSMTIIGDGDFAFRIETKNRLLKDLSNLDLDSVDDLASVVTLASNFMDALNVYSEDEWEEMGGIRRDGVASTKSEGKK